MKLKNKNVLVLGLAKSGLSAIEFLHKMGSFVYAFDDNLELMHKLSYKDISCTFVNKIDENVLKVMDLIVISPGISIFNEYVKLANLLGITVISELQLACYFIKGILIGVTGSNGKTTTVNLIESVLKNTKFNSVMVGNVGTPISSHISSFKTTYITEISSFQLEASPDIKPDIACILNVTPNHLDRHFSFKNYFNLKCQIFKNMDKNGTLILNADDNNLLKLKEELILPNIIWFSTKKVIDGFCVIDNFICLKIGNKIQKILNINDIKLLGEHNLSNIMCAIAVCVCLKVKLKTIVKAISNFSSIPHRLQFVKEIGGVKFFNDSKSTTPEATLKAIKSFKTEPIILLLGGSDKNLAFDGLVKKLNKQIKLIIVLGETTQKIVECLKKYNFNNYQIASSFTDALNLATKNSKSGDVVLLSPACASFDMFKDYEERGQKFIDYLEQIK